MHKQVGNTIIQVTPTTHAIMATRSEDGKEATVSRFEWEEAKHLKEMLEIALAEGKPSA